jgi:glutamine synthetase
MVTINTMMAESLDAIATELEAALAKGEDLNAAIQRLLASIMADHGAVVFNGDGYSEEWQQEAAQRGLLNLRTTVDALPQLDTQEAKDLFEKYEVLSNRELASRYEVYLEQYMLSVTVEARQTAEMAKTVILPAALRYQGELAGIASNLKNVGVSSEGGPLGEVTDRIGDLNAAIAGLEAALSGHGGHSTLEEARYACDTLIPAMGAVRGAADALEHLVADDLWPLPTYQEMLFIL